MSTEVYARKFIERVVDGLRNGEGFEITVSKGDLGRDIVAIRAFVSQNSPAGKGRSRKISAEGRAVFGPGRIGRRQQGLALAVKDARDALAVALSGAKL